MEQDHRDRDRPEGDWETAMPMHSQETPRIILHLPMRVDRWQGFSAVGKVAAAVSVMVSARVAKGEMAEDIIIYSRFDL